jgi:hypothetical protein
MDGRNSSISPNALCGQVDADAAPADSVREDSSVVYSGSAQQVGEGFAIALRAMGFAAGIPPSDMTPSDTTSNPKDS